MTIKDFFEKTGNWLRVHKPAGHGGYQPVVDDEGLISEESEVAEQERAEESSQVVVKTIQPKSKSESLEKLQAGFDKLIEQLRGINEHLNHQVGQTKDLMSRIEQFPKLFESFPAVVENQKKLTEELIEQLKDASVKQEQFVDIVEKIPKETAKQTDALVEIDHQLAAAADTDVQMAESFNKFTETLEKLNQSTNGQTEGIMQMSKTFAASDRYLKYVMSRQRKSFVWVLMVAMGVCATAILILTGIIIYLKQ